MPQGGRKVAFSCKQKKVQLQKKRERKRNEEGGSASHSPISNTERIDVKDSTDVQKLNEQSDNNPIRNINRYRIHFKKETEEEMRIRREEARKPFKLLTEETLENRFEDVYGKQFDLDIPKRPAWDFILSKYELEAKEQRYFRSYLEEIEFKYRDKHISYFEMNLETWRQLWRVLEMSDIILIIADIRHPVLHFPPGLYKHVTEDLKKDIILVLNKIDLVPASLVIAWIHYFKILFPKLYIMCFAAYACASSTTGKKGYKRGKLKMAINGAKELLSICEKIVQNSVDLSSWHQKIAEVLLNTDHSIMGDKQNDDEVLPPLKPDYTESCATHSEEKYREGVLTIGCVGHPNVGKSSLLNAIVGKKVVSVSRTPGHTKHFQTIFLTPTVRLCDCPGLVFPSMIPKQMQVLSGLYPIAQLREPYTSIKYLAERVNLSNVLKLVHPDQEEASSEQEWSAYDICEAWAEKRGFFTSRAARLDTYRAANNLLRMALDGRTICLQFYPPDYIQKRDCQWLCHPDIEKIEIIQGEKKDNDDLDHDGAKSDYIDADTDYSTDDDDKKISADKSEEEINKTTANTENRFALLLG